MSVSEYTGVSPRSNIVAEGDHLSRAESLEGYKKCSQNDLVVNIMLAWKRGLGISKYDGIVSPAYAVFRPDLTQSSGGYLHYLLRTDLYTSYFKQNSTGVIDSRLRLYPDEFTRTPLVVPPLPEQQAIATFLDRETTRIDALIARKERLLELLEEKRKAIISQAVTRGLDASAPMRDSGVEWLGQVPEGWSIEPLKRSLRGIEQGWSPECENRLAELNEWGILKSGCVNHGVFQEVEHKALPLSFEPNPSIEVHPGDILMSRASGSVDLIGSVALVNNVRQGLMLSDKVFRLLPLSIDTSFLVWSMGSKEFRLQIRKAISGAEGMANNISKSSIREMLICIPPLTEQQAIAAYLGAQTTKLGALRQKMKQSVEKLSEYRTSLISAAVTGKIDVRGEVPDQEDVPA